MSSKFKLQVCGNARKSSIFRDNQFILNKYDLNAFISNTILAILMTFMAALAVRFKIVKDIDTIVIGTIMILVPGVAVTNAVRDTINGDILSGTIRTIEAIIIAFGIAFGVGVTLFFLNAGGLL